MGSPLLLQVAGGNGEQVMSRDVHRLGTQFDFFRLLSFYQSGGCWRLASALPQWWRCQTRALLLRPPALNVQGGSH